jgi:ribonuclease HI
MSKDIRDYFGTNANTSCTTKSYTGLKEPPILKNNSNYNTSIKLEAFTDGSAINNGKKNIKGGIGVFFPGEQSNISINCNKFIIDYPEFNVTTATNNVAELLAILLAIEVLIPIVKQSEPSQWPPIVIYSDSEYSIKSVTKWAYGWKAAGWKKKNKKNNSIKNLEIIKKIFNYCQLYRIKFVHINSHMPEPYPKNSTKWLLWYGNDMADKLANKGAIAYYC